MIHGDVHQKYEEMIHGDVQNRPEEITQWMVTSTRQIIGWQGRATAL
jgi:hypothetical protein